MGRPKILQFYEYNKIGLNFCSVSLAVFSFMNLGSFRHNLDYFFLTRKYNSPSC